MNNLPAEKNRRVLVIDDNRAIHDDFRKILCPATAKAEALDATEAMLFGLTTSVVAQTQFEVDSAYQGQEGVLLVAKALEAGRPYAMAFVDVRMPPGWDGVETSGKLWELDPNLQVVLCTAYSDYSWDEMFEHLGQRDGLLILKKPFDSVEAFQLAHALTEKWWLHQQARRKMEELEGHVAARTQELAHSFSLLNATLESTTDGIVAVDHFGKVVSYNARFVSTWRFPADLLARRNAAELRTHTAGQLKDADRFLRRAKELQADPEAAGFDVIELKDGRTFERYVFPQRMGRECVGTVISWRDITERKAFEEALRQGQKLESIGQLAAGIAHEINTPTQFIGDNTQFIRTAFNDLQPLLAAYERLLDAARDQTVTPGLIAEIAAAREKADLEYLRAEVPKAINQSIEGIERVTKIVRAMKEFSHPGTAGKVLLDLNHAIESTLIVCHNEWKYVAELVTEFDPQLPLVPVLPGEFNQVILNLVINAAHAIADVVGTGGQGKGKITLSTRCDGNRIEVRIRDTGTGIPEKARERIFDPFFTTKAVGKGTGQGLAIARSVIVDKHGGTISFETESGKGTCFIIRLPAVDSSVDQPSKAA